MVGFGVFFFLKEKKKTDTVVSASPSRFA